MRSNYIKKVLANFNKDHELKLQIHDSGGSLDYFHFDDEENKYNMDQLGSSSEHVTSKEADKVIRILDAYLERLKDSQLFYGYNLKLGEITVLTLDEIIDYINNDDTEYNIIFKTEIEAVKQKLIDTGEFI